MSKLGLALGGGGARGLAHIGILKVLESEKIKISSITGCSMGALVGGLYAYYENIKAVEDFIFKAMKHPKFLELGMEHFDKKKIGEERNYFEQFFDFIGARINALKALNHLSYFDEEITSEIYELIPDVPIENFKIKFSAISTDLLSGKEINFTTGSLRNAIRASSAIPGIFPPLKLENYFLVDGSTSESVPVGRVKEIGADRVLAVDVTKSININSVPQNVFDILYRSEDITSYYLSHERLKEADLIIEPDVKNYSWSDFENATKIIETGEQVAKDKIKEIRKLANRNCYLLQFEQFLKKIKKAV
jgi:NTE family protein